MDYKSLIYKLLEGNASRSELELVENWATLDESNLEEFHNIKTLWDSYEEPNKLELEFKPVLVKIKREMLIRTASKRKIKRIMVLLTFTAGICLSVFLIWSATKKPTTISCLKFNNTSVQQVIHILSEKWNVNIEVEKRGALECEFTGTFYNRSMEEVIRTIANGVGLSLVIGKDKKYTLKGIGCT